MKYAVIKSAGDLAAKRVRPTAVSVQILFPESSDEQELKDIMRILTEICEETGLAITCVQAESAEYVLQTVIQITAVGVKENPKQQTKKWIPGTEIILCGYTGLEGTLRLVEEAEADLRTRFTPSFIEKTKRCKESLILPKQILKLPEEAKSRQCGDGGVLCGLWELAEVEKIGFEIDFSKLALKQETVEICEFFSAESISSHISWKLSCADRAWRRGIGNLEECRCSGGTNRICKRTERKNTCKWRRNPLSGSSGTG